MDDFKIVNNIKNVCSKTLGGPTFYMSNKYKNFSCFDEKPVGTGYRLDNRYKNCKLNACTDICIFGQTDKLVGTFPFPSNDPCQGQSVALSLYGDILVSGSPEYRPAGSMLTSIGGTYVFTRSGSTWTEQQVLVGGPNTTDPTQGFSVALTPDGSTIIAGAYNDDDGGTNVGSVFVFVKSGSTWEQQANLVGGSTIGSSRQGSSVAISDDGTIIASGAFGDDSFTGAVWIFTYSDSTWSEQIKLVPTDSIGASRFGTSVALNSTGDLLAVGGSGDDTFKGAVWIFTRSGETWTQRVKLTPNNAIGNSQFGTSVSLNKKGTVLAVGGPSDNEEGSGVGATWIFTGSGGTWKQKAKLVGSNFQNDSGQGYSVSLNDKGNVLATGGPGDTEGGDDVGATWIFRNLNNKWIDKGKFIGSGTINLYTIQGTSVSLSGNGEYLAVGGPGDNDFIGATWVFECE